MADLFMDPKFKFIFNLYYTPLLITRERKIEKFHECLGKRVFENGTGKRFSKRIGSNGGETMRLARFVKSVPISLDRGEGGTGCDPD